MNPVIEGSFDTVYNDETPIKAAHKCWMKLSNLLSNNVPAFAFTMQEMDGGALHHYQVKEKSNTKNKKITYELSEFGLTLNKTQKDKVLTLIEGKDYVDVKKTISSIIDLVTEQEEKEEKKVVAEVVEEEQTSVIEETTKPKKKNTLEEDIVSAASTLA